MVSDSDSDLSLEQRLASRCRELVDIPSVTGNEAEVEASVRDALPSSLELVHDHDTVFFLTTKRRPGHDLILLAGHTDTVPIEENMPSREDNGVILGRGSCDMKAGLAVMIELARALGRDNAQSPYDVGFVFFGREEGPALDCPLYAALQSCTTMRDAKFAVVTEPTGNAVEAGCQGTMRLQLDFDGVAAHSARPWKGVNAAHRAVMALSEIATAEPNDVTVDGLLFREVASITRMRSGIAGNVIPPLAEVEVNVRYSPIHDATEAEKEWHERLAKTGARVHTIDNAPPAPVAIDNPFVQSLVAAGAGEPRAKQGWTNVADFARFGVPAVNFGPGDPAYAHKKEERVRVDDLVKAYRVLERALRIEPS